MGVSLELFGSIFENFMEFAQSHYQPLLTLDYIVEQPENKLFDRKSSKIKVSDLAPIISAFANAEGGTIVIGINDKTKAIEGINAIGSEQISHVSWYHCLRMVW